MTARNNPLFYFIVTAITITVAWPPSAYGQWSLGLEAGAARNRLLTNTENEPAWTYTKGTGFYLGIPVQYSFGRHLSVTGGLQYMQKNYTANYSVNVDGLLYQRYTNSYGQLPLSVSYSVHYKRFTAGAEGGSFIGYWIRSTVRGSEVGLFSPNYTTTNTTIHLSYGFSTVSDRRFEAGWLLGGRLGYHVSDRIGCSVIYRFYQSLTGQQKNYMADQIQRFNRTNTLAISADYALGTQKSNRK